MPAKDELSSIEKWLLLRIREQRFPPGFDEWCGQAGSPAPKGFKEGLNLPQFILRGSFDTPEETTREYVNFITEQGAQWSALNLGGSDPYGTREWDFRFPGTGLSHDQIGTHNTSVLNLGIESRFKVLKISNLRAQVVFLSIQTETGPIRLGNCVVATLRINKSDAVASSTNVALELHNCWIGTLVLPSGCLKKLKVTGGGIANVECPSSDRENPFIGDVSFKKVFFPSSKSETRLFQGSHAYGSLYAHLKKLDNTLMANQMRAHQLRSERAEKEEGFTWFANWTYGTFADYGVSPGRSLWWLFGVYIVAFFACYNFDPGMLTQSKESYVGAYSALLDENGGHLNRSLLLPLQSITNPFGVFFDARKLIVPTTWHGSMLLTLQGLFSDILLVMTALSIRRRFKAE
jgi:hypothetical protein